MNGRKIIGAGRGGVADLEAVSGYFDDGLF